MPRAKKFHAAKKKFAVTSENLRTRQKKSKIYISGRADDNEEAIQKRFKVIIFFNGNDKFL